MMAAFEAEASVGPALERSPAEDDVAIMDPDGYGFSLDVCNMPLAPCLTARKTLCIYSERIDDFGI